MNKYFMAAVFVFVIGMAAVGGTAGLINYLRDYQAPQYALSQGMIKTPYGRMKHVHLTLQTFPNFPSQAWIQEHHYHYVRNPAVPVIETHPDWVMYGPTPNLVVPAYSKVTITIQQYDGGETLLNQFYSHVEGTIGNTMTVDGKTLTGLPSNQVAHTFTIHGYAPEGQPYLYVNVPLMKMPDAVETQGADHGFVPHPHVITFSFYVHGPGHYVWQCEYPCGTSFNNFGGPMSTNGYMNGTFDVVG